METPSVCHHVQSAARHVPESTSGSVTELPVVDLNGRPQPLSIRWEVVGGLQGCIHVLHAIFWVAAASNALKLHCCYSKVEVHDS